MEIGRGRANALVGLLKSNLGLISSHMVEFFTGSLFDRLPVPVREQIAASTHGEILELFWQHGRGQRIGSATPLGAFLDDILSVTEHLARKPEEVVPVMHTVQLDKFASVKKGYEVATMGKMVASLAEIAGVTHIADIGAGKGYLSGHLAIHYCINVLGIDCSASKTASALERSRKMQRAGMDKQERLDKGDPVIYENEELLEEKDCAKSKKNDLKGCYKQITQNFEESTCLTFHIQQHFSQDPLSGFGVVSLHGCGDLSPCLVQHFASKVSPSFPGGKSLLAIVPCCYHLLSSWPQSDYMRNLGFSLPKNSFMHASKPLQRLASFKSFNGELLLWRAVLEVIFRKYFGEKVFKVGRIGSKATSFNDYVKKAFHKLNLNLMLSDAEIEKYLTTYKCQQQNMDIYFLVLTSLASAVEATILVDLLLCLKEKGVYESWLVQLFDPVISPRCHALIAFST